MTKQDSQIMKGVAILLMLFLHLFNQIQNAELCQNTLFVGGVPLAHLLTRACNPVPFFIILSGYGLYVSHHRGAYNVLKKLKSLYIHYWITLLVFVTLGFFVVGGQRYPGGIVSLANNITGWNTTYNGEIWFLFPYVLVMLSSRWIVRILDKYNPWLCLGVTFFLNLCTGYTISRYGEQYLYNNQLLYMPVLYVQFLFDFCLGAYTAKYQIVKRCAFGGGKFSVRGKSLTSSTYWLLLLLLVVFRCCFRTGAFHGLYVFAFIILFVNAPRPAFVDRFLMETGRRSTSMWFVHSYFCYYLFPGFIYGFRYPVLIFCVLLACSYLSAVVIDWVNGVVQKK